MEKIKVNMSPNPLDVQTIHASQNDGEARRWEFELHNNGELIDTSDVKEQLFFKAYKGGTEEILPTNGSVPTTSPFKGDIRYPQGLLTDQEFTYRESPTPVDGLAKIKSIKGNTLVWNQSVQVSNIVATKTVNGITFTNNADGTVTMSGTAESLVVTPIATGVTLEQNHVYYLGKGSTWSFMNGYGADGYGLIKHNRANANIIYVYIQKGNSVNSTNGIQCIDLTKLFGETKANEIFAMGDDGIAYLKSLFPLDYYAYDAGTLLSFNGTGLKSSSEDTSKEDILALPVATYFPTGMKSTGIVYDELTPVKAITRVGAVDLGTLDWTLSSSNLHIFRGKLTGLNIKIPNANDLPNALLANYLPYAYSPISANDNGYFAIGYRNYDKVDVIVIIDNNYSDNASFISHISGQYLYYEMATPTEISLTTASLVTENGEIPLSNDDGVLIGKCTEQLSENPGFIDAKIKLSDIDGECYSNKLQLHIERSPQ